MERTLPSSDWVAYAVVLGTVAAMLLGKYLMFFNDKASESQTEELDDQVEKIAEDFIKEELDSMQRNIEEKIK